MKKMTALMMLAMIVALGCESDNPTTNVPINEVNYYLYFDQAYNRQITGLIGDTVEVDLKLHVLDGTDKPSRRPVPNAVVKVEWYLGSEVQEFFDSTSVTTDTDGIAELTVRVPVAKGYEDFRVIGTIGDEIGSAEMSIVGYSRPARMIISSVTHRLIVPLGQVARIKLDGLVIDSNGVGVPDMVLTGRLERIGGGSSFGGISISDRSNSAGNFSIYYNSTGGFGAENVVISGEIQDIPESVVEGQYRIETVALENQIGSLSLYALPGQVILPAANEAVLVLNALVLDAADAPLPGVTVSFESSLGVIQNEVVTDSVGFAHTVWHTGLDSGRAVIAAKVNGTDFESTGVVEVKTEADVPSDPVASISLFVDDLSLVVGSGESTYLRALCLTESGRLAESGTLVGFEMLEGDARFRGSPVVISNDGVAYNELIIGTLKGVNRLRAFVDVGAGDRIESNDVHVMGVTGEPERIEFTFDSQEIPLDGSTLFHVRITDYYNNPVEGEIVRLTTTRGEVTPTVVTNESGLATGQIVASAISGIMELNWIWRNRSGMFTITVRAGAPDRIELSANPVNIGRNFGENTTRVTARVLDAHGTALSRPAIVMFKIIREPAPPEGCVFANGNQLDSAWTANGSASTVLVAGTQVGGVVVKAYTWRDEARTDTVSTILSTIQVEAGMPTTMELDVDPRGIDAGGGIWDLTVSIRSFDVDLNPSSGEYPIWFDIAPNDVATIAPVRMIDGTAVTRLSYPSSSTFSQVEIHAFMDTPDGMIEAINNFQLPLQRGFLTLSADPQNWMFNRDRPNDIGRIRVWAILRDGHDEVINNAPIIFSADRARYYWYNPRTTQYVAFFPNVVRKYTGVVDQDNNEQPGTATVYLQGVMNDFYLDEFTLETNVHLEARVEGMDVFADPLTVFITRH